MQEMPFIVAYEAAIRLSLFLAVFVIIAVWELWAPKRVLHYRKARRWLTNWGMVLFNTLLVRLLFPVAAVGVAQYAQTHQTGLMHALPIGAWLAVPLAVVALDWIIYWQHRLFHRVPVLWRFHQVHHADPDYDVSLGARFHPVEILLSMLIKSAAILLLGAPVMAVILFEVGLNALAMFNHGNIALPARLDRWLRVVLVTPDMHRVHHSNQPQEMNRNFGFQLAIWDRWFGSYQAQPALGHQDMVLGLDYLQPAEQGLSWWSMMRLPFGKR